ncbi:DUF4913 domain-containing protein [Streptomyces sp. MBT33]|uniref:DUF4913 domain-containing protein n=1 Tax=Streptomyces sp. MBT33 TaxID=1488363 RepID=UPI00190ADE49|nr:DUF4913 domain-containing protein [Streptomyces sp. MBT33]MBK3640931.1 DUF4913 domain-containing protein [Streptomyces sp. MBT33]
MTIAPEVTEAAEESTADATEAATADGKEQRQPETQDQQVPAFILYMGGSEYDDALHRLALWVRHLLLPVYGREVTSASPWCTSWWKHPEAVAQLYGLWMAWHDLTGPDAPATGPATWHRDHLGHVMSSLRDPSGPFAGCKAGAHRAKETPGMDPYPG